MRKFILIFILITISFANAQTGKWKIVDRTRFYCSKVKDSLGCFYFGVQNVGEKNIIAVGNAGITWPIARVSKDGGKTWETTLLDTPKVQQDFNKAAVRSVSCVDTSLSIILCDSCVYWRSTDGWKNWARFKTDCIRTANQSPEFFIKIFNMNCGILMTVKEFFTTNDGGLTFNKVIPNLPDSLLPSSYTHFDIPENNVIIVVSYKKTLTDYIIRSDDGGITWEAYKCFDSYYRICKVNFLDKNIGYAIAHVQFEPPNTRFRNVILKTEDGGKNWRIQLDTLIPAESDLSLAIKFADYNNGIALGWRSTLWRTTNGGDKWFLDTSYNYNNVIDDLVDIAFISHKKMIGVTQGLSYIYEYSEEETSVTDLPSLSNSSLAIYPNPVSSTNAFTAKIKLRKSANIKLKIYNTLGNLLEEKSSESASDEFEWLIATDRYPTGAYCVRVESDAGENASKVFVVLR